MRHGLLLLSMDTDDMGCGLATVPALYMSANVSGTVWEDDQQ